MKRLLTNVLVVALAWPVLAVGAVAATGPDEHACCLRSAHHCHVDAAPGEGFQALSHPCQCCQSLPVSSQIAPASFARMAPVMISARLLPARQLLRSEARAFSQRSVRAPPRTTSL